MDDQFSTPAQFWLDRELAKVRDPKRRRWLAENVFAGEDGYQAFLKMMRNREGAKEFTTGEWQEKLPKFKKSELNAKRWSCIGCRKPFPPRFTPWGELFEDFEPICCSCRKSKTETKTDMNENLPANTNPSEAHSQIEGALKTIEANKPSLKEDLRNTLLQAKKTLSFMLSPGVGFTFEQIFSDPEFEEIAVTFGIRVRETTVKSTTTKPTNTKGKSKVKSDDDGNLGAVIVKLMKDGVERSRPHIKRDLKKEGIKVENEHQYAVKKLVDEGKLTESGTGRNAVYKIAKSLKAAA